MIKKFLILACLLTSSGLFSSALKREPKGNQEQQVDGTKRLSNPGSSPQKKREKPSKKYSGHAGCMAGRMMDYED